MRCVVGMQRSALSSAYCNCLFLIIISFSSLFFSFFFFNDTATTEIYTLSLHDALPIWRARGSWWKPRSGTSSWNGSWNSDRKSTRLNSSHVEISYAVFCLKKKKNKKTNTSTKNSHQQ